MNEYLIRFRKASCSHGAKKILRELDLEVRRGETFALLGRSGCGKTTTLKMVNRLIEPEQGEVVVEGRPTTAWDPIRLRRRIGYVIQEVGLFPHYTVEQNVGLIPSLEGWDRQRIRQRAEQMLALVGLDAENFSTRYPHQLSGGQKQRVGVARALAADPPILLMDEPFGSLDPLTRREVQEEFGRLKQRLQKTILLVTHDLQEAFLLGDRIGVMEQGRLLFSGSRSQIMASDQPQVTQFLKPLKGLFSP